MLLQKPEPYQADPGRVLTDEEKEDAAKKAIPINQIKSRSCYVEATNDKWRLGRK